MERQILLEFVPVVSNQPETPQGLSLRCLFRCTYVCMYVLASMHVFIMWMPLGCLQMCLTVLPIPTVLYTATGARGLFQTLSGLRSPVLLPNLNPRNVEEGFGCNVLGALLSISHVVIAAIPRPRILHSAAHQRTVASRQRE